MREYIIDLIVDSVRWQKCIDCGLEDELPTLEKLSNEELLEFYDFYV